MTMKNTTIMPLTFAFGLLFVTACYFYGVSKRPNEIAITIDASSCTELTQSGIDCDGTVTQ